MKKYKHLPFHICPFIHASVMYKKTLVARIGYNIHAHSFEDHLTLAQVKTRRENVQSAEPLLASG